MGSTSTSSGSKQRINGLSFDVDCGSFSLKVLKFSLDITDNGKVAKRAGRPSGYLLGDVEASGTITVGPDGLKTLAEAAKSAGSWQQLAPFDINSYAKVGDDEVKVEAFGCKVRLSKMLDIDKSSSEETTHELPFDVTSEDFVKINGVPYAKPASTSGTSSSSSSSK